MGEKPADGEIREYEILCHRCHGLGWDSDDLDCMFCDGMGTVVTRY